MTKATTKRRKPERPADDDPKKVLLVESSRDLDLAPEIDDELDEQAEGETPEAAVDLDEDADLAAAYALTETEDDLGDLDDLSDLEARRAEAEAGESGGDPVRMYLREIGSTPLLSADQELRICATFSG